MPAKDWWLRIEDILAAILKIQDYTAGMDQKAFAADSKAFDAVLRNLTIIGEAVRHIPDPVVVRFGDVPWNRMRAMRNFLVHDYPSVDLGIVWHTIREDLPPLVPLLQRMLAAAEDLQN